MPDPKKYPLTYDVRQEEPPLTPDEVQHLSRGAADAVVILSMIYPPDGSFSLSVVSLDGRTGEEVTDNELWKVWTMLSYQLARSKTLAEPKRELAETLHECVATALRAATQAALTVVPEGDDLCERIKRMLDVIPPHERVLQVGLRAVSDSFRFAPPEAWHLWRDRGTEVLEQALMQRPSQRWIERVKAIWLGRE
jgi:hypothetical protein